MSRFVIMNSCNLSNCIWLKIIGTCSHATLSFTHNHAFKRLHQFEIIGACSHPTIILQLTFLDIDPCLILRFVLRRLGENSSISYFVKLLETHAQPIEVLAMQIVHKYITKVKNMPNDMKLPKPAWNIRYKVFQNVTERPCMYVCMYIYKKNNYVCMEHILRSSSISLLQFYLHLFASRLPIRYCTYRHIDIFVMHL